MGRVLNNALTIYSALILLLFWVPIGMIIAFSFKAGGNISFPYEGLSLFWYTGPTRLGHYGGFLNDPAIMVDILNSILTALLTMAITTPLVIGASLGLRKEFPGKDQIFYLLLMGMVIPGVIFGVGLYFFYHLAGFELGLGAVLPAHIVWALPFGLILMLARFDPALASYEEVARTLGAGDWKVFREVTMPLIFPQIVATALFAFVLSWSEVIRSKILLAGGWSTLPVYIYNQLTSQPMTPKFYALGAMTVFVSVTILVIAGLLMTRGTSRLF